MKKAVKSLTQQTLDDDKFEVLIIDNTPDAEKVKVQQ